MPLITDWISSIASLVGGVAGIGALIVAILSYLRSSRALAADRDVIQSASATLSAVEALGAIATPDDEAIASELGAARAEIRDGYAAAIQDAKEHLHSAKTRVMTITCPHCGTKLGPFSRVGRGIARCGHCGKAFTLR